MCGQDALVPRECTWVCVTQRAEQCIARVRCPELEMAKCSLKVPSKASPSRPAHPHSKTSPPSVPSPSPASPSPTSATHASGPSPPSPLLFLLLFLQYVHLLLLLHLIFPRTSFIPIQYQAKELVDNNVSVEDNFFNGNAVEQVSSFQKALLTWCIKGL